MKAKTLIILGILILGIIQLYSQSSIVTSGADAKGNGGSVSFSVGQLATAYYTAQSGSVSEGVQYPYEIYILNVTDNFAGDLTIYPNPTSDYLILKFSAGSPEAISIKLSNMNGQVLKYKDITDKETYIELADYPASTYFISLINKNKLLATYKIIKNRQ